MLIIGLKLRLKDKTPITAYTYTLFPLMDKCVPAVEWKLLVTGDGVQSQHIRCHQLIEGDDLSMLVSDFKEKHAKAVILINTHDSYSIAPQFLKGQCGKTYMHNNQIHEASRLCGRCDVRNHES